MQHGEGVYRELREVSDAPLHTGCDDELDRYAENRPGTSLVADAINAGHSLP